MDRLFKIENSPTGGLVTLTEVIFLLPDQMRENNVPHLRKESFSSEGFFYSCNQTFQILKVGPAFRGSS